MSKLAPRASATIKLVSPEVSSVPAVPPVTPPPDRIEQLFQELCVKIREYRPRDDIASVEKAFRIASELHKSQLRQSGEPYMVHPLMVAHILAGMRMDLVTIETGLLHDLVEDTRMTPDEIRKGFGDEVARCVDGVTKLSKLDIFNAEERQAESFRKMLLAMVDDIRVIIVKLADRLHNMRTLGYLSAARTWPPKPSKSTRPSRTAWAWARCAASWKTLPSAIWIRKPSKKSPRPSNPSGIPTKNSWTKFAPRWRTNCATRGFRPVGP